MGLAQLTTVELMSRGHVKSYCVTSSVAAGAVLCALLAWCGVSAGAATSKPQKAPNPHWQKDGCGDCHAEKQGKHASIPADKADEICLKCHDGRRASMEFHPVGRVLDPAKYNKPAWPMPEGRLGCLTCHDMLPACSEKIDRPGVNRMLLRDFSAGRSHSQPFCQNCHKESTYQKLNPHIMLMADKDEIIEEKCLFCHESPQDRKQMTRTGKPALKHDQTTLCRDCHQQHKDPMIQGHIGLKLSDNNLAYMRIREQIGLNGHITPKMIETAKADHAKPTMMVPGADGTIVCSTCHNPHQYGVFPAGSVLGYRAMRLAGNGKPVSPVHGQMWCRYCHEL
jgi:predicted CXXCH cytochrome family protein